MCGNVETQPPQPTIGLTYEQLEQLYFTQCECTDEWADKYKLSQEENEKLIHDLSEYISIANISTTQLAQAQAEKAELVRAARDLVNRWHTPKCEDAPHTGEFIAKLEALLLRSE